MTLKSRFGGKSKKRSIILPARRPRQGKAKRLEAPACGILSPGNDESENAGAEDSENFGLHFVFEEADPVPHFDSFNPFNSRNNYNYARRIALRVERWLSTREDLRDGFEKYHLMKKKVVCECCISITRETKVLRVTGK